MYGLGLCREVENVEARELGDDVEGFVEEGGWENVSSGRSGRAVKVW